MSDSLHAHMPLTCARPRVCCVRSERAGWWGPSGAESKLSPWYGPDRNKVRHPGTCDRHKLCMHFVQGTQTISSWFLVVCASHSAAHMEGHQGAWGHMPQLCCYSVAPQLTEGWAASPGGCAGSSCAHLGTAFVTPVC